MATFGTLLKGMIPGLALVPKGTGDKVAQFIANTGQKYKLPEVKLSEQFGNYQPIPKAYAQSAPVTKNVQGASTSKVTSQMDANQQQFQNYVDSQKGTYNTGSGSSVVPSSSGESVSGGGDSGGYDYLGALRNLFGQSKGALEAMLPTYDSDYANYEKNATSQIDTATQTKEQQDQADEATYGKSLKSLLQSDRELKQRRQGVFSGLNSLDSSAYRDDVTKGDQALLENQQELEGEKRRYSQERSRELTTYVNDVKSKLGAYSNEISRAKQGLQQAIASVNMDEASSIQNYIDKITSEAQQLQSNLQATAMNLAQLQAQGTDVVGNLSKMNMGAFANTFGQNLAKRVGEITQRYSLPQQAVAGSGYINPSTGKSFTDEERRLLGI